MKKGVPIFMLRCLDIGDVSSAIGLCILVSVNVSAGVYPVVLFELHGEWDEFIRELLNGNRVNIWPGIQ